ncbi:spindle and kinetochore-associated protein 1 isoform X1 [Phycodurus eques]|uniref:spindle and kinetochore-associated protein 1 isoform X1 n=2 Tax=Phycodurus eques TaxID=693459 RepID=UPI002ACDE590|nr:spindle and kinetochore-associated protein 1 isoform X1 [Phycodurus eques]
MDCELLVLIRHTDIERGCEVGFRERETAQNSVTLESDWTPEIKTLNKWQLFCNWRKFSNKLGDPVMLSRKGCFLDNPWHTLLLNIQAGHLNKAVEELFQNNRESLQHLKDNVPAHMPNLCPNKENEPITHKSQVPDVESTQQQTVKIKSHVRQIEFITLTEFECIPRYMKGRLSYDQLNKAVENINTAVVAKYKIFHQPLKTLNNHARKLYQRFKDQETKDTKGEYFVVEDDFREFTQMKVDKRLQGILNMLRHCQRLRELRGGGITRYMFL